MRFESFRRKKPAEILTTRPLPLPPKRDRYGFAKVMMSQLCQPLIRIQDIGLILSQCILTRINGRVGIHDPMILVTTVRRCDSFGVLMMTIDRHFRHRWKLKGLYYNASDHVLWYERNVQVFRKITFAQSTTTTTTTDQND